MDVYYNGWRFLIAYILSHFLEGDKAITLKSPLIGAIAGGLMVSLEGR